MTEIWDGQWVADNVGIGLIDDSGRAEGERTIRDYVGLALRRNPRRAHLLVSHFLGKHIPADPRAVYGVGLQLGRGLSQILNGELPLVLGYAETATGLGHGVADELDAPYLHSTRRAMPGLPLVVGFEEEHSHATGHRLLPEDPGLLSGGRTLVLVDDELSTGRTAANTIRALHAAYPRRRYIVASLLDVRSSEELISAVAAELSIEIVCATACLGTIVLPEDVIARAERVITAHPLEISRPAPPRASVSLLREAWPAGVRDGGRHGFAHDERFQSALAARGVAARLAEYPLGDRVLVLGFEELMHAPMLIGVTLADWSPNGQIVRFSSTTRSPVFAIDEPGYAIRTALRFPAHDDPIDGPGPRYVYNVAPGSGAEPFTDIVLVIDDVADRPELHTDDGLIAQLRGVCERLFVVVVPSYRPGRP